MSDERSGFDEEGSVAAEFALGLLEGEERAQAERRMASDADFAREVARWRGRFATLNSETTDRRPPSGLWGRIEAALNGSAPANDNVVALRRERTIWRSATAAMTAVAAALALILLLQPRPTVAPTPTPPQPAASAPMVAIVGGDAAAKVVVSWEPSAKRMIVAVAGNLPVDARHSHELWVIPADGKPRSLGVLGTSKQAHMQLANALADLLQQGATIAISVEPKGGSPTGAPTGPVVASGALARA
jgi:anti-sigma-K factor RskA